MTYHNFYDTETTGPEPKFDQILQAAAILTDDDFVELDWLDERSRLAGHIVPTAGALKVTHVDPYSLARSKYSPYEFAHMLHELFSSWMKKGGELSFTGYNTIRYDEEIMRQMFWQNLLDPYLSSGKNTYRNDLLTVTRALYARNPECLLVPVNAETGKDNFKLENLAVLNGFEGHDAHDALSDVRATIFLARLIRDTDQALWEHMLAMGNSRTATDFVDQAVVFRLMGGQMLNPGILDVCLVASEATNPKNKTAWNLAFDPLPHLDKSPDDILAMMRTPGTPFRTVKCNKQPAAFPMGWEFLNRVVTEGQEAPDAATIDERVALIQGHDGFKANVAEALRRKADGYDAPNVLEEKIYAGFPSWEDKNRMKTFHTAPDWNRRLEVARSLEKPEMRQLGFRTVYLNAPEAMPQATRDAFAAKIAEERYTLALDKPWTTVGKLMAELDEMLAASPEDPMLLNIRAWAIETYPTAALWTGVPASEEVAAETVEMPAAEAPAVEIVSEIVVAQAEMAIPVPAEAIIIKEVPSEAPVTVSAAVAARLVEASQVHFLDGLD